LSCWGSNEHGETGTGTVGESVPAPAPVQTALRFTRISAQGGSAYINSTCALTAAGEAWCWGENSHGKLGDGTTTNSAVPVRVQSDVPFASIETGYFHSCALATTGELWCWGEQEIDPGAFGARPTGLYTTPVALHDDFRFTDVAAGWNYTCGVTAEHAAYCWGTNFSGGLGRDQTTASSAVPLPVTGGHSFLALSAAGYEEVHALTPDGVVYRWGDIGFNNVQPTPVPVTDLRFAQVDSGDDPFDEDWKGACGIVDGNAVYCARDDGQVRGVPAVAAP
jgi:alpha-tubulin suppressor-like RCC1 family protein